MKRILLASVIAFSAITFSCNNDSNSNEESHTDSVANQAVPGNSPVQPNANNNGVLNGNQINSGAQDTGLIDSIVGPDTVNSPH